MNILIFEHQPCFSRQHDQDNNSWNRSSLKVLSENDLTKNQLSKMTITWIKNVSAKMNKIIPAFSRMDWVKNCLHVCLYWRMLHLIPCDSKNSSSQHELESEGQQRRWTRAKSMMAFFVVEPKDSKMTTRGSLESILPSFRTWRVKKMKMHSVNTRKVRHIAN